MNPQPFQESTNYNFQVDGAGDEWDGGIVHFRNANQISSRSGFLPLQSSEILSWLAVPANNHDLECNSEIIGGQRILLPVSSAALLSQDFVEPSEINDDRRSVGL